MTVETRGSYGIGRGTPSLTASFVPYESEKSKGHVSGVSGHGRGRSEYSVLGDGSDIDAV